MNNNKSIYGFISVLIFSSSILLCSIANGQVTEDEKELEKKYSFSIQAGVHRSLILIEPFIEPEPFDFEKANINYAVAGNYDLYDGYYMMPETGYQLGMNYEYNIKNNFKFITGFTLFTRQTIYEGDHAFLLSIAPLYENQPGGPNPNVIRYRFTYYNMEIPLLFLYEKRNFAVSIGVLKSIAGMVNSQKTYFNDQAIESNKIKQNITSGFLTTIYPDLKLYYWFNQDKYPIRIFLGLNGHNLKSYYYLQAGVCLLLKK